MDCDSLRERIKKFYAHNLPDLQSLILAKTLLQFDLMEVLQDTIIHENADNKFIDVIEERLPFAKNRIIKQSNVAYTILFENNQVELDTENKKVIITAPSSKTEKHYRCNTGICINTLPGSALLLYCKDYKSRPLVVDTTSDSVIFLEFVVPANENESKIEFNMVHFLVKSLDKSRTQFKDATKYFAKYGVLSNYKSESNVELNIDGHMDTSRETYSDPQEINCIIIVPRRRIIGEIISLYGRYNEEVYNPNFDYGTPKASFMYPIFKIDTKFTRNDNFQSRSKNGGFNGCFYQIKDYSLIVEAFKILSKTKKHVDTIKARINAKIIPKSQKEEFIEAIIQRCKNMTDITAILKSLPTTVEEFAPIDESMITIPKKIERQKILLENITIERNRSNFAQLTTGNKRTASEEDANLFELEEKYLKKQKLDN